MTITLTREEAQQVLDLMTRYRTETPLGHQPHMISHKADEAIETLRARLSAPEPEPVAWMYEYGTDHGDAVNEIFWHKNLRLEKPEGMVRNVTPLYTAPPQHDDIYEEGCTPADFRVLREANARMAQELFELRSKK
jgi:hypothetical protein